MASPWYGRIRTQRRGECTEAPIWSSTIVARRCQRTLRLQDHLGLRREPLDAFRTMTRERTTNFCASLLGNSLMKALKRSMASEYCRELGTKVLAGQRR